MKTFLQNNHRILFYSCWAVLGIIQSRFTELLDDEAYYWVYSKFLDWGYFDHPPMVAIFIKTGYFLFQNELGVRLIPLIANILSLLIIERIVEQKNTFLFYVIALSLAVLQLGGFFAVPDSPLILFTALFFLCYKKFLQKSSLPNTVLLGLVMAALFYSKYHAFLIIFFVLMSNLKLLTRYQVYAALSISLLLFIPHLYWQYQHNWISFRYHLVESNVSPYKFSHTLEYVGEQILLAGPLAGVVLLPAAVLYQPKDIFQRGLKFTLAGIYIFFLLSSFRGKVEANWTSPAIVPLMILSCWFFAEKNTRFAIEGRKWLWRLLPATMVVVLFARIIMIVDILPAKVVRERYHAWKDWPLAMKEKTRGLPIVFENSYQRASKYWFYSGQMTYSLNWYRERRNNYNFWPIEDSLLGKPVFILDIYDPDSFQTRMSTGIGLVGYKYDSSFSSFAKVKFIPSKTVIHIEAATQFLEMNVRAQLPPAYYRYISTHPFLNTNIVIGVFNKGGWVKDIPVNLSLSEIIQRQRSLRYNLQLPEGRYFLIFSVFHPGTIIATHNSERINLIVH